MKTKQIHNMNNLITILLLSQIGLSFGQEILFEENFDDNKNGWTINNDWNRKSTISNGLLTDYFMEDGYRTTNIISAKFDKSIDHCITLKIANLNNQKGYYYNTFKKKSNGSVVKANKVDNPSFAITIGFKDWDNYHAIEFYTFESSYGVRELKQKIYSVTNGETIIHKDWSTVGTLVMDMNTGFNTISIIKSGNQYSIYCGEYSYDSYFPIDYLGKISISNWYGEYFGFIIPAGTKIGVDYIKVTKKNKTQITTPKSNFEMPYVEIRKIVDKISEQIDSVDIWINTSTDGNRKILINDNDISGLPYDEYTYCLKFSKQVFELMFYWVNYSLEKPINYDDLVHAMKSKSIIGMEFKTSSSTHTFNWEKITAK